MITVAHDRTKEFVAKNFAVSESARHLRDQTGQELGVGDLSHGLHPSWTQQCLSLDRRLRDPSFWANSFEARPFRPRFRVAMTDPKLEAKYFRCCVSWELNHPSMTPLLPSRHGMYLGSKEDD